MDIYGFMIGTPPEEPQKSSAEKRPIAAPARKLMNQAEIATGYVIGASLAMAAAGFAVLSQIGDADGLAVVITGLVLVFAGRRTGESTSSSVPLRRSMRELHRRSRRPPSSSGALGIAILGSISTAASRGEVTHAATAGVPAQAATAARDTLGGDTGAAEQLLPALLATATQAFTDGLQVAAAVNALALVGVAIMAATAVRGLVAPQTRSLS